MAIAQNDNGNNSQAKTLLCFFSLDPVANMSPGSSAIEPSELARHTARAMVTTVDLCPKTLLRHRRTSEIEPPSNRTTRLCGSRTQS